MSARNSAATERAIARVVDADESMYSAAKAEGITYNTLHNAIKRLNGAKPPESSSQKAIKTIDELRTAGELIQKAFLTADEYAQKIPEYVEKHSEYANELKNKLSSAFIKTASKKGRPSLVTEITKQNNKESKND
jgi:transposase-like protein